VTGKLDEMRKCVRRIAVVICYQNVSPLHRFSVYAPPAPRQAVTPVARHGHASGLSEFLFHQDRSNELGSLALKPKHSSPG